jgi:hypothetical protein
MGDYDSDYDYDEYFAKNLIDDSEQERTKENKDNKENKENKDNNKEINGKVDNKTEIGKRLKFNDELDFIISSKDDDDTISSKFSKSLKVSRTKGKSLTNRQSSTNNSKRPIKAKYDDVDDYNDYGYGGDIHNDNKSSSNQKREINKKATLEAILERQKRLEKINEKKQKKEKSLQMKNGIELLFNIMKTQNIKILEDVRHEFKSCLPFNIDMETEFIKPPYLTPKIVAHKLERLLNQT